MKTALKSHDWRGNSTLTITILSSHQGRKLTAKKKKKKKSPLTIDIVIKLNVCEKMTCDLFNGMESWWNKHLLHGSLINIHDWSIINPLLGRRAEINALTNYTSTKTERLARTVFPEDTRDIFLQNITLRNTKLNCFAGNKSRSKSENSPPPRTFTSHLMLRNVKRVRKVAEVNVMAAAADD